MSPAVEPTDPRRRRLTGALVAMGLVGMVAGAALAVYAPRLLDKRPAPAAPPAAAPVPPVATPVPEPAPAPIAAPPPAPSEDLARLGARLDALEGQEGRIARAAAASLAAAALVEVSQGSRPFPEALAALRAAIPVAPELSALSRLAETGAPSRASLADSFPDYAARAAAQARRPADGAGLADRILYALTQVVSIRRVGEGAVGVDGALSQAERRVLDGDIDGALRVIDALPAPARETLGPWRDGAQRRAEIDRLAATLRARSLSELAAR